MMLSDKFYSLETYWGWNFVTIAGSLARNGEIMTWFKPNNVSASSIAKLAESYTE